MIMSDPIVSDTPREDAPSAPDATLPSDESLDKRGGGAFSDADFERLELASEQVAFALDNALLFDETERRALEKDVLLEVTKTLSASLDLDQVIEAMFRALRQVVHFDAAAIY